MEALIKRGIWIGDPRDLISRLYGKKGHPSKPWAGGSGDTITSLALYDIRKGERGTITVATLSSVHTGVHLGIINLMHKQVKELLHRGCGRARAAEKQQVDVVMPADNIIIPSVAQQIGFARMSTNFGQGTTTMTRQLKIVRRMCERRPAPATLQQSMRQASVATPQPDEAGLLLPV